MKIFGLGDNQHTQLGEKTMNTPTRVLKGMENIWHSNIKEQEQNQQENKYKCTCFLIENYYLFF